MLSPWLRALPLATVALVLPVGAGKALVLRLALGRRLLDAPQRLVDAARQGTEQNMQAYNSAD